LPTRKQSQFVRSALISGIVTQQQIDEAVDAIRSRGGLGALPLVEVGDELLAKQLTAMEYLTSYQAAQLRDGRTKLNLGPYVITDWLGQGGMGQVFVAVHQIMGRKVAIKVLPKHKSTPEAISSFNREIRTQAQLDHKNLVRAYDAGNDGNTYFLVTEYVPGTDLRKLIRSQGPLTMRQAAWVIMQAAAGLEYAHQQRLIHRDVKPGNILVTSKGIAKVSDLGLAGFLSEAENDPRANKIVGTADYLAPEKILTPRIITPVSDIYSLGCTLYYAVTGKVPFPGGTTRDKARRHCEETPWHPRQFNPDISDELVDLIADMMEKDPARRIQTAGEVAKRLEPWASQSTQIPNVPLKRSPWMPPPVPTGREDTVDDFGDLIPDRSDSDSQASGPRSSGTMPVSAACFDTDPARCTISSSPAVVHASRRTIWALAIAIPISAALGGFLTWLIVG
jgi:serine/threonine protein kinase